MVDQCIQTINITIEMVNGLKETLFPVERELGREEKEGRGW